MQNIFKTFWNNVRPIKYLNVAVDSGSRNRPTIVMLHGIAATSKTWNPLLQEINTHKYRIVVLDLLGFGKSASPIGCSYTTEDHLFYVRRTLRKLRVKTPFVIMGHSMGSIIAARYCHDYPDEINSAYLLSLPLYLNRDAQQTKLAHTSTDLYFKAYDFLCQNKDFAIKHSQRIRKIFSIEDGVEITDENWDAFRLSLKNTIIKQTAYDDIKNSDVPMNVIYGSLDEFLITESINKLGAFENVTIKKLNVADHTFSSKYAKYVVSLLDQASETS